MADSYDQAATQIDENKRAMLAAMAAGGTAQVQAHQRAQAEIAAQQQAAVQGALASAASRNAPQNVVDELTRTIGDPYARYQADLSANQAYSASANAGRQAANEAYFAQAKAAIPALRNASQIAAAERAAKAAEDAERASGGEENVLTTLSKQLGGIGNTNKFLAKDLSDFTKLSKADFGYRRASVDGTQPSDAQLRDLYDREAGLPEGYSNSQKKGPDRGKIISSNEAALRMGIPLKTRDLIWKKSKSFQDGRQVMRSLLSEGKSWAEVTKLINSSKTFKTQPLAKKMLLEMYREAFGG